MSDSDDDKTKLRAPSDKAPVPDDATRIIPDKSAESGIDESNKTRIAPSQMSASEWGDVTRLAEASDKNTTANAGDEKTRLAPPARPQQSTQDKATVIRDSDKTDSVSDDVTRFRPGLQQDTAGSGEPPPDRRNDAADDLDLEPLQTENIEHSILKNRFVLEKVLGVGGMGIVYKAKDLLKVEAQDRDPYVAIKVLSEEFKAHPEAFISLQRESRKSQRIAHPNIVNVYDFDRDDNTVFMTMEFLDGSPLDQIIRQYKSTGLPTDYAWDVIKGMSSALSYAHAEKIIHSDFKPGNVFVTKKGIAKVFDFGIARAVAQVEQLDDNPDDKTVFDAGNLGALTPAYASLEMLEGKEPDVRDDIYALGCVAYELFTGEHPYNKVPADEAERQGLKPKRISNIKKTQWRAIEKAIAFRRADRIATVDQFVDEITPNLKAVNWLTTGLAILLSVLISGYFLIFQEKKVDPYSEFDIRNELELKIKIDFYKEDLASLIDNPSFTDRWQDAVWKDVSDLAILTEGKDPWLDDKKLVIYNLYLNQISSAVNLHKYSRAEALVVNAKRYSSNVAELEDYSRDIAAAKKLAIKKQQRQATAKQNGQQAQKTGRQVSRKQSKQEETKKRFDVALANVNAQLKCQNRLNMRNFETAINKLKELDRARYDGIKNKIVSSLATCITNMGKAFPERALEAKKSSLRLFNNNAVLAGIKIDARDPCDRSLAGLGARGKRAVCKDKIKNKGAGPELVVIPGNGRIKAFAIGKYEVSIDEFNNYCKSSSSCSVLKSQDGELPASAVSFNHVKNYLKWLSRQSGQRYRLPTKNEWVYAAKSRNQSLDANRNCKLSTRGIQKGEMLVKASIGKQNKWGLVNYVGNVQEWVYDQGRKLVAVGGSYKESMENCNINTSHQHNGQADITTGFRVLRELRTES